MSNKEFNTEGLRSFTGSDQEANYYIVSPVAEDIRGADWEYSKTYTKSLVEGITTAAEMTDILMRRGIIGPEFEQRSHELAKILSTKIGALSDATLSEEKQVLAFEVAHAREELFQWNQRLNAPLSNSCEQIADDARLEFLTSRIIVNAEGDKCWPKFDDYLVEKQQGLAQKARFEVMLYLQGLDSDFLEQTPEAMAVKELEQEALSEITKEALEEEAQKASAVTKEKKKVVAAKTRKAKKPVTKAKVIK